MKKKCFKCGRTKQLSMFYAHPQMADGHLNKCKECAKKDVREHYRTPHGNELVKNYEQVRQKTPERKAAKLRYQQARRQNRPGTYAAHNAVSNALRDGRLVRKPCEVCGIQKSEAHHEDYRKKLDVRWLCFRHHREAHGQTVR